MTVLDLMTMLAQCPLSADVDALVNITTQQVTLIVAQSSFQRRTSYSISAVMTEPRGIVRGLGKRQVLTP